MNGIADDSFEARSSANAAVGMLLVQRRQDGELQTFQVALSLNHIGKSFRALS
jgi:hypothetical protein